LQTKSRFGFIISMHQLRRTSLKLRFICTHVSKVGLELYTLSQRLCDG
jgi:hypothetical protein